LSVEIERTRNVPIDGRTATPLPPNEIRIVIENDRTRSSDARFDVAPYQFGDQIVLRNVPPGGRCGGEGVDWNLNDGASFRDGRGTSIIVNHGELAADADEGGNAYKNYVNGVFVFREALGAAEMPSDKTK